MRQHEFRDLAVESKCRYGAEDAARFFRAAFARDASALNVQVRLDIETPGGSRLGVVQITGLIARRIVSYLGEGEQLVRGQPYGLICYGSRLELYLPESATLRVRPGERVRHTSTVLAELRS